jgi:hypothetical protein
MIGVPRSVWLVVVFVTFLPDFLHAADPRDDVKFLLAGMRKERTAIRSGVCRINGRLIVRDPGHPENNLDGPVEIFAAFEGTDKIRFDRSEPGWVSDKARVGAEARARAKASPRADPSRPSPVPIVPMIKGLAWHKYAKNPQRVTRWTVDGGPIININAQTQEPPPAHWGWVDLRGLGLYYEIAIQRRYSLERLFEAYAEIKGVPAVEKNPDGVWTIVWDLSRQTEVEWQLTIDTARGFTPIHYLCRERSLRKSGAPWKIHEESKTQWDRFNDVWVPIHHEVVLGPGNVKTTLLDLTWESVNTPVDPELFEYKTFGAPESVMVVDQSLGQPVSVWDPQYYSSLAKSPVSLLWRVVAGVLFALVFSTLVWVYWRRRRAV